MPNYKEGLNCNQQLLLPPILDEYVGKDNPLRAIESYVDSVRSSRKLEREFKRNVEMMWLCAGLTPGHKTIANFRKDNPAILKQLFREFVILCRSVDLIARAKV